MRPLILSIVAALILSACGYKGPLYLPKSKPEARKPAPAPAPATAPQEENQK